MIDQPILTREALKEEVSDAKDRVARNANVPDDAGEQNCGHPKDSYTFAPVEDLCKNISLFDKKLRYKRG